MAAEVTQPKLPDFVVDMLGQHLHPGDRIAYAITVGRSAALVVGRVLEFRWSKAQWGVPDLKIAVVGDTRTWHKREDNSKPALIHANLKKYIRLEEETVS